MKNLSYVIGALCLIVVLVFGLKLQSNVPITVGSIGDGQAYYSTSTKQFNGTAIQTLSVIKAGQGTFGSVVVTGATAGQTINVYDATTSDVTQRVVTQPATTTIVNIPTTALGGTYTFDVQFKYGLLVEVIGATGTSTLTWR